jgi:hypothetical protein
MHEIEPIHDPQRWYAHLSRLTEKLETLSRLSPMLESDQETALTLSILLDIIGDYVTELRVVVQGMAVFMQERGGGGHE